MVMQWRSSLLEETITDEAYRRPKRRKTGRVSELPTELLTNIFCRLPVKTILQFRCVCKTWYAILTVLSFISMYTNWCANNQYGYLTCYPGCQIERLDKQCEFSEFLEFPIGSCRSDLIVVGSFNGLICLTDCHKSYSPSMYIWNPSIRAYKKLPEITDRHKFGLDCSCVSGFGFDSQTNDYKVFHTMRQKMSRKSDDYVLINRLYSLKTDSWKLIQQGCDDYDLSTYPPEYHGCRAYFDGAFYWIPTRRFTGSTKWFIIWFDFCDEKFRKANLPIDYDDDGEKFVCMRQVRNMLVLFICETEFGSQPCFIHVWMMKKRKN